MAEQSLLEILESHPIGDGFRALRASFDLICKDNDIPCSSYCSIATAAETTFPTTAPPSATPTITAISDLPPCGQTCMSNMIGQYSTLGCASPQPTCLCQNVNFGYGIRDCANGACGTAVGSTVISFGLSYCSSATAAA
ncbi:hypothetical protein F5884DRAFT_792917 [Xylogone sp. PMI_703]|nr:hypothetical protein F5884DRAFT_792917 [Xylogone sp. PMI_703]